MPTRARAIHVQQGNQHAVGIGGLRVLVCEKDGEWFAQGIEIDYAASGRSLEDVKNRFERGLLATVHAHLLRYSTVERLLRFAPKSAWEKLTQREGFDFSLATAMELSEIDPELPTELPFERLVYLHDPRLGA